MSTKNLDSILVFIAWKSIILSTKQITIGFIYYTVCIFVIILLYMFTESLVLQFSTTIGKFLFINDLLLQ